MMLKRKRLIPFTSWTGAGCTCGALVLAGPLLWGGAPVLADSTPVLVFQHAGCAEMMPSEKDAGLRRAVEMLAERLTEIPAEVQRLANDSDTTKAMWIAERILPLVTATFEYPGEFAILDNGINELGVRDFDLRIVFETGARNEADKLHAAVNTIFQAALPNAPLQAAESNPDFLQFPTPIATLLFGPDGDHGRFALGIDLGGDGLRTDRVALTAPAEFGNITPVYQFHADGLGLIGLADFASTLIPEQAVKDQIAAFIAEMPEAGIDFDVACGFRDGRAITISKLTNFSALQNLFAAQMPQLAQEIGFIPTALLRAVPADARLMTAANQDLHSIVGNMLEQIAAQSHGQFDPETIFEQIEAEIGIHPINDLLAHLGSNWLSYTSDSTGGGGLLSLVFVNNGADGAALVETLDQLNNTANAIASMRAMGYVRCQSWGGGGLEVPGLQAGYTLTFPGLPIPLELSLGVTEDSLVAGLSRQAVQTAVMQSTGATFGSILDNPRFAKVIQGELEEVNKIAFVDTAASINRGYPMAQLIGAAVANFVRSPNDPGRDPGMVTPPYHELAAGAHGMVQVTFLTGDDIVQYTSADASWFVNIAGLSGSLGITPELIGAGVFGAALGANAR